MNISMNVAEFDLQIGNRYLTVQILRPTLNMMNKITTAATMRAGKPESVSFSSAVYFSRFSFHGYFAAQGGLNVVMLPSLSSQNCRA